MSNISPGFTFENLRVEDEAAGPAGSGAVVRVVTIDRPGALNAIDVATMGELATLFDATARLGSTAGATTESPVVRAVIVTGAGDKAFVAGADIAALSTMSPAEAASFSRLGHLVGARIEALPVPVIAAVNGFALGGGCELALACDFIYAADGARFGQPEVKLGAIPGFGGTQRLMQRVGVARARELLFTGDTIDAAEALRIGLCNRVVPAAQLMPEARRVAAAIAARAPLAVAAVKRALREGADLPMAEALQLESALFGALFATADLKRGMQAFLAKDRQPPSWQSK